MDVPGDRHTLRTLPWLPLDAWRIIMERCVYIYHHQRYYPVVLHAPRRQTSLWNCGINTPTEESGNQGGEPQESDRNSLVALLS